MEKHSDHITKIGLSLLLSLTAGDIKLVIAGFIGSLISLNFIRRGKKTQFDYVKVLLLNIVGGVSIAFLVSPIILETFNLKECYISTF